MSYQQERPVEIQYIECAGEGCKRKVPNHYWGKVKATDWFFSRDGKDAFCPEHLPTWVETWRRNKKLRQKRANA
jgi:hypothetical protein